MTKDLPTTINYNTYLDPPRVSNFTPGFGLVSGPKFQTLGGFRCSPSVWLIEQLPGHPTVGWCQCIPKSYMKAKRLEAESMMWFFGDHGETGSEIRLKLQKCNSLHQPEGQFGKDALILKHVLVERVMFGATPKPWRTRTLKLLRSQKSAFLKGDLSRHLDPHKLNSLRRNQQQQPQQQQQQQRQHDPPVGGQPLPKRSLDHPKKNWSQWIGG